MNVMFLVNGKWFKTLCKTVLEADTFDVSISTEKHNIHAIISDKCYFKSIDEYCLGCDTIDTIKTDFFISRNFKNTKEFLSELDNVLATFLNTSISDKHFFGNIDECISKILDDIKETKRETKTKRKPITTDIDMIKDFTKETETAELAKPLEIKPKIYFIGSLREENVEHFHVDIMADNKRIGSCELYIEFNENGVFKKAICRFLYIIDDDFKGREVETRFLRMLANEYNGLFCVPYDSDDCKLYYQIGEECKIPCVFEWSHVVEKCFFISPDKNNERDETDIDNFNKKSEINSMYGIAANTTPEISNKYDESEELLAVKQFERLTGTLYKSLFKAIGLEDTRRIPIIISNNMVFFNYNGTQYKYNPAQCKVYKKDGRKYQRISWKYFTDDNSATDQKQARGRSPPLLLI